MSLVALNKMPLMWAGGPQRQLTPYATAGTSDALDAANEAVITYGDIITEDGASHTIDTTGSSSLGMRIGASTVFANAGTTVKVGLAALDLATGPPTRAANAADVITFDVSRSMTGGGGGIVTNSWCDFVPTAGTKTIANGDPVAFCMQMTARAGADLVNVTNAVNTTPMNYPGVTGFLGAAYGDRTKTPGMRITFSDGVRGYFAGGQVISTATTITWNSGSATTEYGNVMRFPFPVRAYGIAAANLAIAANLDLILYSDPLGTPVAQKTVSVDGNAVSFATLGLIERLFPAPYDIPANTWVAAIVKPTTTTNITHPHYTYSVSGDQDSVPAEGYAVNRASGAFAAQNSNKDRFSIGLLIGAFGYNAAHLVNGGMVQ